VSRHETPQTSADVGGLVPERTADPAEAAALVARDGAAILTGRATDEDGARQVARDVLGDRLVVLADPAAVREGGEKDRSEIGADDLMPLHVDGFAYGDRHLDAMFLLCVSQGTGGGASFLADGYAVLDHLASSDPELHAFVHDVPVDLTETDMQPACSPIVLTGDSGRRAVRRHPFMAPAADSDDPDADRALIERWRDVVRRLTDTAPRFSLDPGDALCVDNYRVLHGRDPYAGERFLWRIWAWTTASNGVPDVPIHSDSRYAHTR